LTNPCAAHGCSACCHDTQMPLTEEDAARLESLGNPREAFSLVDAESGELRLRNVKGACFFLDAQGRCSVYASRPAGCRTYPFVLTPEGRLVRDVDCPWRREFAQPAGVQRRLIQITGTVAREAERRS